jgi:membrane fusion protein, multidrug efflux system
MSFETLDGARKPRRVVFTLCVVAIAAAAAVFFGVTTRARSKQEVSDWTNQQAIAAVRLVQPEHGAPEDSLVLPGNINAYYVGTLFARATGYVTAWNSDIGAHVSKGQTLAVIAAPDLDQQLEQAKAQLVQLSAAVQQAQANADLGKVTDQRTSKLVSEGWSSQAQGDTDRLTSAARDAALTVAKANVVAQQAAVNRLTELTGFEQIKAPFDGVVTARNVDIGNLVSADGASGSALFQVADIHRMRIYVNVPQAFLGELRPGIKATLNVPGQQQTFEAELVSMSNALVPNSRTGLVELQADNPDGKLWPGAFAEVHFHIPADPNTLSIPSTALIFGSHGMQVATINSSNKVELKSVVLGRDLGNKVEIESGLTMADRLVDNPMESVENGDEVRVADTNRKAAGTVASDRVD